MRDKNHTTSGIQQEILKCDTQPKQLQEFLAIIIYIINYYTESAVKRNQHSFVKTQDLSFSKNKKEIGNLEKKD